MTPSILEREFCKTANCPSSEVLLRYRRHQLPLRERASIEIHLRRCDFCSAELHLLTQHRAAVEERRCVEMPVRLRQLAQDLLRNGTNPFVLIDPAETRQTSH
jgi:hypothetical protein